MGPSSKPAKADVKSAKPAKPSSRASKPVKETKGKKTSALASVVAKAGVDGRGKPTANVSKVKSAEIVTVSDDEDEDVEMGGSGDVDPTVEIESSEASESESEADTGSGSEDGDDGSESEEDGASESDLDSDPDVEASKQTSRPATTTTTSTQQQFSTRIHSVKFEPPAGFNPVKMFSQAVIKTNLATGFDSSNLINPTGQPDPSSSHSNPLVWHISAPTSVAVDQIHQLVLDDINSEKPVTSTPDGIDYSVGREKCNLTLMVPTVAGYQAARSKITQSLNFRPIVAPVVNRPELRSSKPGHVQPAGLKMRYRPTGSSEQTYSGNGMPTPDDSGSDDDTAAPPKPVHKSSEGKKRKEERKERKEKKEKRRKSKA